MCWQICRVFLINAFLNSVWLWMEGCLANWEKSWSSRFSSKSVCKMLKDVKIPGYSKWNSLRLYEVFEIRCWKSVDWFGKHWCLNSAKIFVSECKFWNVKICFVRRWRNLVKWHRSFENFLRCLVLHNKILTGTICKNSESL